MPIIIKVAPVFAPATGGAVKIQPEPAEETAWLSVEFVPAYHVVPGVATECWIFR